MLPDFGWTELLVVAIVLIVVVGPKDLPKMLRTFGKTTSSLRKMAGDFRKQFDEALKEAELDDVREIANDLKGIDPRNQIKKTLSPLSELGRDVNEDLKRATKDIDASVKQDKVEPANKVADKTEDVKPAAKKPAAKAAAKKPAATKAKSPAAAKSKSATRKPAAAKATASKSTTRKPASKATASTGSKTASAARGTRKAAAKSSGDKS